MVFFGFFEENIDFFRKIGHLKNGLRIALRLFYKKIRTLLGFGVGKLEFLGLQNLFLRGRLGNCFSLFREKSSEKVQRETIMTLSVDLTQSKRVF